MKYVDVLQETWYENNKQVKPNKHLYNTLQTF